MYMYRADRQPDLVNESPRHCGLTPFLGKMLFVALLRDEVKAMGWMNRRRLPLPRFWFPACPFRQIGVVLRNGMRYVTPPPVNYSRRPCFYGAHAHPIVSQLRSGRSYPDLFYPWCF